MQDKQIEKIIVDVLSRSEMKTNAIPDLDLYIDQITTLFDREFQNHKKDPKDKIITKTMVNNYSKQGVIEPISGKKYSKDRIVELLMVYAMKNTLTIEEISLLMQPLFELKKRNEIDICEVYDFFVDTKISKKEALKESVSEVLNKEKLNLDNEFDRIVAILGLCAFSEVCKQVAKDMVQHYYKKS